MKWWNIRNTLPVRTKPISVWSNDPLWPGPLWPDNGLQTVELIFVWFWAISQMGQIQMKFDTFNELIQILKIWGLTFYSWCDIIYGLFDQKWQLCWLPRLGFSRSSKIGQFGQIVV